MSATDEFSRQGALSRPGQSQPKDVWLEFFQTTLTPLAKPPL
jgi:hypothetical protein